MWILLQLQIKPHKLHLTYRLFPTLLHYFPRTLIPWQNSLGYWNAKHFQFKKTEPFSLPYFLSYYNFCFLSCMFHTQKIFLKVMFFPSYYSEEIVGVQDQSPGYIIWMQERSSNNRRTRYYIISYNWAKKVRLARHIAHMEQNMKGT